MKTRFSVFSLTREYKCSSFKSAQLKFLELAKIGQEPIFTDQMKIYTMRCEMVLLREDGAVKPIIKIGENCAKRRRPVQPKHKRYGQCSDVMNQKSGIKCKHNNEIMKQLGF